MESWEKMQKHIRCNIQGNLFKRSAKLGFDSEAFIAAYMNSDLAARYDLPYDSVHWLGHAWILEELDDCGKLPRGESWNPDVMHWIGYVYNDWHMLKGISSKEMFSWFDGRAMYERHWPYHTLSYDMTVDWLLDEIVLNKMTPKPYQPNAVRRPRPLTAAP